jgi:hypothetical protein
LTASLLVVPSTNALFLAMDKLAAKVGMPTVQVMTDFCGERCRTLVAEMGFSSMDEFERMMQGGGQSEQDTKEFARIMKDYHDLVEYGRREVYKIGREATPERRPHAAPLTTAGS